MNEPDMPLGKMMALCLKWAVAAIPAVILLFFVAAFAWVLVVSTAGWLDGQFDGGPEGMQALESNR